MTWKPFFYQISIWERLFNEKLFCSLEGNGRWNLVCCYEALITIEGDVLYRETPCIASTQINPIKHKKWFLQNNTTSTKTTPWYSNIVGWRERRKISVNLKNYLKNTISKYLGKPTFILGRWDLSLRIPCRVISWQSYLIKG